MIIVLSLPESNSLNNFCPKHTLSKAFSYNINWMFKMHVVCNKQILVNYDWTKSKICTLLANVRNNTIAWKLFLWCHGVMNCVWKVGVWKWIWMFHSNQIALSKEKWSTNLIYFRVFIHWQNDFALRHWCRFLYMTYCETSKV